MTAALAVLAPVAAFAAQKVTDTAHAPARGLMVVGAAVHGADGELTPGGRAIDADVLAASAGVLERICASMVADAGILLCACDVDTEPAPAMTELDNDVIDVTARCRARAASTPGRWACPSWR